MAFNIKTGYNVPQRKSEDIIFLVSRYKNLVQTGLITLFTNKHAYLATTTFFSAEDDLGNVDWPLLRSKNFQRDPNDPEKMDRYQAEALVHNHVPLTSLLGVAVYSNRVCNDVEAILREANVEMPVRARSNWYF